MPMLYTLQPLKDAHLERVFRRSFKELNEFFPVNWEKNTPKVFVIKTRKEYEAFVGYKTQPWMVGNSNGRLVTLLAYESLGKESSHCYSRTEYDALLKHELCHSFMGLYVGVSHDIPLWINEGTCLYLADQLRSRNRTKKLKGFLGCYRQGQNPDYLYSESGFAVALLVEKFGKAKYLKLLKGLGKIKTRPAFNKYFQTVYHFAPTYKNFNALLDFPKSVG